MIIDKLTALLGYELDTRSDGQRDKYEQGLKGVEKQLGKLTAIAKKGALALVALGTGMAIASTKTAEGIDELGKFGEATGLSVQEIQRMSFAAGIFGSSQEQVVASLDNVQQKLAEFRRGQGDFQLLGQIGVSAAGVDAIGFMDRLAERFQNFDAQKAQEFGRKLGIDRDTVNLLKAGTGAINELKNEYDELAGTLTQEQLTDSANFIDSQFRLRSVLQAVQRNITTGLIPSITKLLSHMSDWIKENREVIESGVTLFIEGLLVVFKAVGTVLETLVNGFQALTRAVGSTKNAILVLGIAFLSWQLATSAALATVAASMARVGVAATLLNAKVLLLPVLIAAAVAAVLVVIQDLWLFFTDPEALTFTGKIANGIEQWADGFFKANENARELLETVFSLFDKFTELTAVKGIGKFIGESIGAIAIGSEGRANLAAGEAFTQSLSPATQGASLPSNGSGGVGGPFATRTVNNTTRADINMDVRVTGDNVSHEALAAGIVREGVRQGAAGINIVNPTQGGQ